VGFNTSYLGHLRITPTLNRAEVEWLSGFADWGALPDGDPFRLPMNPRAALSKALDDVARSTAGERAVLSPGGDGVEARPGARGRLSTGLVSRTCVRLE
jgi:hypothetical protein